ncbi:hypothetical protein ACFFRR_010843 [Megaselia abdita]
MENDNDNVENDTTSSASAKVKTKVTSWLSEIREEVNRRKIPGLQKWVDFSKLSKDQQEQSNNIPEPSIKSTIWNRQLERTKEICHQYLLPSQRKPNTSNSKSQEMETNTSLSESLLETSTCLENDSGIDLKSNNTTLNDEENFNISRREDTPNLKQIGRSSTVYCTNYNDKSENRQQRILNFKRSLSVRKEDDEDEDHHLQISNNNNSISANENYKVNGQSLQNLLPVSPIRKVGLSKEASFSEESPHRKSVLLRDSSLHSDSSHCSSVDSLLEARKPDPEAILINLGFGPVEPENVLDRIPKRFLRSSQVKGINTDEFVRQQHLATQLHDHSVLGYRGLLDFDKELILQRFHPHQ